MSFVLSSAPGDSLLDGEFSRLLSLWRIRERPSREVKAIADQHITDLEARVAEMQAMVDTLRQLSDGCAGDERPDWPILEDFTAKRRDD